MKLIKFLFFFKLHSNIMHRVGNYDDDNLSLSKYIYKMATITQSCHPKILFDQNFANYPLPEERSLQ